MADKKGGDAKIDIYIVDTTRCVDRGSGCDFLDRRNKELGAAIMDEPYVRNTFGRLTSSGFILLDLSVALNSARRENVLIHEIFHIQQYAINIDATFRDTGVRVGRKPMFEESWWNEASAHWAEWYYLPRRSMFVHKYFITRFQPYTESLLLSDGQHNRASYIWPFFAQQEAASPTPIFASWQAIRSASDLEDIDAAIDAQLRFGEYFAEFAVRNLNLALPGSPIVPTYVSLDGKFPLNVPPQITNSGAIREGLAPSTAVTIPSLAAQYDHFLISDDVVELTLDFNGVSDPQKLDVDAIIRIEDRWTRVRAEGGILEFCRAIPLENVEEIYVILSNHARARVRIDRPLGEPDPSAPVTGAYTVKTRTACGGGEEVAGQLLYNEVAYVNDGIWQKRSTKIVLKVRLKRVYHPLLIGRYVYEDAGSTYDATVKAEDVYDSDNCPSSVLYEGRGSGRVEGELRRGLTGHGMDDIDDLAALNPDGLAIGTSDNAVAALNGYYLDDFCDQVPGHISVGFESCPQELEDGLVGKILRDANGGMLSADFSCRGEWRESDEDEGGVDSSRSARITWEVEGVLHFEGE